MGFLSKLRPNDRLNYGTLGSGRTDYPTQSTATTMPTQTAPAYNEGIQTLVNTYTPPTDISSQVAAQNVNAGNTNAAAQTLAEQQAATYANMFGPRTTEATPTEDTSDVNTGGDDTSGTDTSGTVNTGTTSADGGLTVGPVVGGTTNTGLTTQDLINDYLQSQGVTASSLSGVNFDIPSYTGDLGIDASISGAMGGTDMGMGGNAQINPLTDRPFSQPFFRPQDIPLMETPIIDYISSNNNFMNSFNPRTDGFGQMPQGFEPMGIETLSNKRGR